MRENVGKDAVQNSSSVTLNFIIILCVSMIYGSLILYACPDTSLWSQKHLHCSEIFRNQEQNSLILQMQTQIYICTACPACFITQWFSL